MDLHYYKTPVGNFGDDLNLWLWDEILPGWREARPGHLLVGVGTLINARLPRGVPKIILGSGLGYGDPPDAALMAECRFLAVRGPLSERDLGLPAGTGIVDPAVLVADMAAFRGIPKAGRPVFVPHHSSVHRVDWQKLCDRAGLDYLSPEGDAREVIRRLAAAPLVIAESMHAVILADALGTPWHAVSASPIFLISKWQDWAASLAVDLTVTPIFPLTEWLGRRFPAKKPAKNPGGNLGGKPGAMAGGTGPLPAQAVPAPARKGIGGYPRRMLRDAMSALELRGCLIRLQALRNRPGQLSDRAVLAAAKARYRSVLARALQDAG